MKKILSLTLIIFLLIGCSPKLSTIQMNTDLKELSTHLYNGDYEKFIEYMPTDFWSVHEKSKFLVGVKRLGNQTGNISINNLKINNVSHTIKSSNKYFKVITYSADLEFDSSNISDKLIANYKSQVGADNVKLDTIHKLIKINNTSQMISVYEDKLEKWKYLEFNPQNIAKIYGIETWTKLIKYVR